MSHTNDAPGSGGGGGVTDHGALTGLTDDDHTQYQKESEKSAANGYASLDASVLVPTAELGSGTADATTFLRGDQSWAVPAGGGGGGGGAGLSAIGPWGKDNVQGTVSDDPLTMPGSFTSAQIVMPYAGRIRGLWARLNEARTAGTLTVRIQKNNTNLSPDRTVVIDGTNTVFNYDTYTFEDAVTFAAGDRLRLLYTTSGFTPTTADLLGDILVEFDSGAWTTYDPAWTASTNPAIGNGTKQGAYRLDGKTLHFRINLIMGSTTTFGSGDWSFGLPSGIVAKTGAQQTVLAHARDTGTAFAIGAGRILSAATSFTVSESGDASTPRWRSDSPFTWANTDELEITGTIEVD